MEVTLYNKNRPVLPVEIKNAKVESFGEPTNPSFLPMALQQELTTKNINKWLEKRRIPETREGLEEARRIFGLKPYTNVRNMFSLVDQYWFKWHKSERWENLNFFTNRYSSAPGRSFFAPWNVTKEDLEQSSPDLTTNGVLKKVWVQDENLDSYLIKAGSKKYEQEPISEILATMYLEKLNIIPIVHYDLCVFEMTICSKCRCFVTKDTEFVPAQYIYNKERRNASKESVLEHFIKMCKYYEIPDVEDYMIRMILADYVIGNTDRHFGNFGLLRDVNTGSFLGFSPLFDFGSAFNEFSEKNENPKTHIFKDEELKIVSAYRDYINVKELYDVESLYRLIDLYPDLSYKQKDSIKIGIQRRLGSIEAILSDRISLNV